jgi:arginase family enzyme
MHLGKNIDEIVRLVNRDGKQYYLTIDGRYLDPSLFANAATGTKTYDQDGNVINN